MALSAGLEKSRTPATRISTKASCTVDKVGDGFKITRMRLEVRGKVPGLDQAGFVKAADGTTVFRLHVTHPRFRAKTVSMKDIRDGTAMTIRPEIELVPA